MQPLRCSQCHAPLPKVEGASSIECSYCRQVFHLPKSVTPEVQVHVVRIEAPSAPYSGSTISRAEAGGGGGVGSFVSVVGRLLVFLGPLGIFVVVWSAVRGKPLSNLWAPQWDGKTPISCTGNDRVEVEGVTATFASGTAITATGNCEVRVTRCVIKADTGIDASGNARVVLVGGSLQGTRLAIDASGNARVESEGAKVTGKSKQSGSARVPADAAR